MTLADTPALRVLSYNIRYDDPADPFPWRERRAGLAGLLQGRAPDVFGLQEVLAHQLHDLSAALPDYAYVGVGRGPNPAAGLPYTPDSGEHNPVFYRTERLKLLGSGTFWLSSTPERPGSKFAATTLPRIATWAKLVDTRTGSSFCLANTHFPYEEGARGEAARASSAEVLLAELGRVAGVTPTILTGDFNFSTDGAPDSSQTYAHLRRRFDDASFAPAPHRGPEVTYVGFAVTGAEVVGRRIDYIFTPPETTVLAYETLTDHNGAHYFSDHLPVVVDLAF